MEEVNKHWDWLLHNLLHSLSVFENKEDVASFVKGKVKVGRKGSKNDNVGADSGVCLFVF